jgi:hypothetical protein
MKPPIFLWEPNDLLVFNSAEAAEGWIEWQDVDEGTVYDSEGRLLQLFLVEDPRNEAIESSRFSWFRIRHPPSVKIRKMEDEPTHQAELREAILQAFAAINEPLSDGLDFDELCARASTAFVVR